MNFKKKFENEILDKIKSNKREARLASQYFSQKAKDKYLNIAPLSFSLKPIFLSVAQELQIKKASEAFAEIVQKITHLYFKNPEIKKILNIPKQYRGFIEIEPGYNIDFAISRFDLFLKDGNLRFLEINENPGMIGDYDFRNELFCESIFFKKILKKYKIKHPNLRKKLLQTLIKCYQSFGGRKKKPNIAFVILPQVPTADRTLIVDYFKKMGHPFFLADPRKIKYNGRFCEYKNIKIDIAYKRILFSDIIKIKNKIQPLVSAYKDRRVCLINNFRSFIAGFKPLFCALSLGKLDKFLTPKEKSIIKKYIPFTTFLKKQKIKFKNKIIDLIPYLKKHKDIFVIKPAEGYGGRGVYVGRETDYKKWKRLVEKYSKNGQWLVQEFVEQPEEVFPDFSNGKLKFIKKKVNHNAFLLGGKYCGCFTRVSEGYISNISQQGKAASTFVFAGKK